MVSGVSLPLIELGLDALGPLADEVVFVGAAVLPAWITDPAVFPLRQTTDCDCVIDVQTKARYDAFGARLRKQGLREDAPSRVICRWRAPNSDLEIDVMPSDQAILGFSGRWMADAHLEANAERLSLESGRTAKLVRPHLWLAMKIEAFITRGRDDFYPSKDFEDLVSLVRGRVELIDDVGGAESEMRS